MKISTEFNEWFNYFESDDVELVYQMFITVRDVISHAPFEVKTDGKKITLSCSINSEIRLLIASDKARKYFLLELNKWAGDIELKYELAHLNTGIEQKKDKKFKEMK